MMAMEDRSCFRPILAMSMPSITIAPPHSSCSLHGKSIYPSAQT